MILHLRKLEWLILNRAEPTSQNASCCIQNFVLSKTATDTKKLISQLTFKHHWYIIFWLFHFGAQFLQEETNGIIYLTFLSVPFPTLKLRPLVFRNQFVVIDSNSESKLGRRLRYKSDSKMTIAVLILF